MVNMTPTIKMFAKFVQPFESNLARGLMAHVLKRDLNTGLHE